MERQDGDRHFDHFIKNINPFNSTDAKKHRTLLEFPIGLRCDTLGEKFRGKGATDWGNVDVGRKRSGRTSNRRRVCF
jgi:hypothetical protein